MPYIKKAELDALREAAEAATLDRACFGNKCTHDVKGLTWPHMVHEGFCAEVHGDRVRSHHEAWIIYPIVSTLAAILTREERPTIGGVYTCPYETCKWMDRSKEQLLNHYADHHVIRRSNQPAKRELTPGEMHGTPIPGVPDSGCQIGCQHSFDGVLKVKTASGWEEAVNA